MFCEWTAVELSGRESGRSGIKVGEGLTAGGVGCGRRRRIGVEEEDDEKGDGEKDEESEAAVTLGFVPSVPAVVEIEATGLDGRAGRVAAAEGVGNDNGDGTGSVLRTVGGGACAVA